jgi:hypothetical protein
MRVLAVRVIVSVIHSDLWAVGSSIRVGFQLQDVLPDDSGLGHRRIVPRGEAPQRPRRMLTHQRLVMLQRRLQ